MSRIRSIKPEFFLDDEIAELDPLDRLLYIGLWTQADREGRLADRPKKLKAALLPFDSRDVDKALARLAEAGFIVRYDGFIECINFTKHQCPNVREPASTIPAPCQDDTGTSRCFHGEMLDSETVPYIDALKTLSTSTSSKSKSKPLCFSTEIVGYLNEKAGTHYKPGGAKTLRLVGLRLAEGFTVDDFKKVIDRKCADWLNDSEWSRFLRPETLFGTKFEGYLNAPVAKGRGLDGF